ncbi:MAG: AsmA family protein [Rhodocyclales bacterium]|nr:AsmA family protein [Rhodocyclales bacterium]
MKIVRLIKIVGIGLLALLLLLVGTLYALFDGEKIKSELSRVVMEKTQRRLDISGPVALSLWPDVGVRLGHTSLSEHAGTQEFLAFDSARVSVAVLPLLSKQVAVNGLELDGLKATVVTRKDGTRSIDDLTGGPAKKAGADESAATPLQIDISHVRVTNARLTWRDEKSGSTKTLSDLAFSSGRVVADSGRKTLAVDALKLAMQGQSGTDKFTLKLDAPKLALSPEQARGDALTLSATLAGTGRKLDAQVALSGISGALDKLEIAKFDLGVDMTHGETQIKVRLTSPVAVNLTAQTLALEKLAGGLDLTHPALPMKQLKLPLAGSARVDLLQQTAQVALGTQFDESKIVSRVDLAKFSPLKLKFDLAVDRLDVDRYFPPRPASASKARGGAAGAPGGEAPLDFSALKTLDLTGAVRIGALQVNHLKFADLNARLTAAGGRLDVAPLSAKLYQGAMNGSLMLNANGNAMALRQTLSGISIAPLLKDLADKDILEGRGNVALDISGHGATPTALKKSLAGSASLSLKDGAIKGINLAQSLRDIKAKLGARKDVAQQARATEKTDFSELAASFRVTGGVAHNDDLTMKSPFLRLGGAGDIDIGNGRIDYLARASVVSTSAGQEGKELAQLKGVTVPVRLSGPFENISWKIEFGSVVADAVKEKVQAKVDEKKQEIQQKAGDKLKDKLKGLFGK